MSQDLNSKLPHLEKGTYRHAKTGRLYEVIGVALEVETSEAMVVYRPKYESEFELFVRPFGLFTGKVVLDGHEVQRFEMVNDD